MSNRSPSLPRMPWFPSDFHGSTRGWPLIPRAIYRELLDASWDVGGLPNDENILRRMVGATPPEWRAGWPTVLEKFVVCDDGKLRNLKLEEHREKAIELWRRRSGGARKTNRQRWGHEDRVVPIRGDES